MRTVLCFPFCLSLFFSFAAPQQGYISSSGYDAYSAPGVPSAYTYILYVAAVVIVSVFIVVVAAAVLRRMFTRSSCATWSNFILINCL